MRKSFKAIAALLAFVAVYFLVSTLIYLTVLYINGGSVFSPMNWRAYGIAAFANAWAGYLGVVAGRALLGAYLKPYPPRFVGISFVSLLGLWFIPLTLIYLAGASAIFFGGGDMGDWPPEGELGEYFLGLVRAIVAVVCAWVMLVKRDVNNQTE